MIDCQGRKIEYLRVSVTPKCNLNCIYCRPGCEAAEKGCNSLTPADYKKIVGVMAGLGIRKVRITGGEPLLRPDISDIVAAISGIQGINDISLTTNGIRLAAMAPGLKKAGLKRVNISLDSLKEERFAYITGGGRLKDTLAGVEAALKLGLSPVKINTVLIKGVNDDEIDDIMGLARDMPVDVRFIELMPVGAYGENNSDKIIFNRDIIEAHPDMMEVSGDEDSSQPARYYRKEGYLGRIGFISPMSHKFCDRCNRIRLTWDGRIRPCLGDNGEIDIFTYLKGPDEKLSRVIEEIIFKKPLGHNFEKGFQSKRGMEAIGG